MKNKKKMWERMSVISATLLAVTIALSNAGTIMEGQLNEMLGLKNYELVTENADPNENTTHFEQLKNENNIEEYYRDVNVAVESEGLVLLKNENNALPLKKGEKIALFGKATIEYIKGGGGSGDVNCPYIRNIADGFKSKEAEGKVSVYMPLVDFYKEYVEKENAF